MTARPIPPENQIDGAVGMLWLKDATHQSNRETLELTFLHDVLNDVIGLRSFLEMLLGDEGYVLSTEEKRAVLVQAERLYLDIVAHRDLALADAGKLATFHEAVDLCQLADEVKTLFQFDPRRVNRSIRRNVEDTSNPCPILFIDKRLTIRVIINMVSNALEATPENGEVEIRIESDDESVRLHVHNECEIPPNMRPRIFHRFASVRETGRGLGTYSMKLLTETYLGGTITFVTSKAEGTTFTLCLPTARPKVGSVD